MLRIYPVLLQLVAALGPLVKELERHDPDLAKQCRRALTSAPLNLAEGSYSRGKNRPARYHTALGSLREVLACFEVAEALGYLPGTDLPVYRILRRRPSRCGTSGDGLDRLSAAKSARGQTGGGGLRPPAIVFQRAGLRPPARTPPRGRARRR
jgi:four helix bundle protein